MRKKNGFVISTTLYSIFGIMLLTVFYILYALSNNRYVASTSINGIKDKLIENLKTLTLLSNEPSYSINKNHGTIIVSAGETKSFDITIKNETQYDIMYKMWYKFHNDEVASNVVVGISNLSVNSESDILKKKGTTEPLIREFEYTGSEQEYIVPTTGTYEIEIAGAEGTTGNNFSFTGPGGGLGAILTSEFELESGDLLKIIVGGQGTITQATAKDGTSGAGGGGTFVFKQIPSIINNSYQFTKNSVNYETLLVAAGGGGSTDNSYKGSSSSLQGAHGIGDTWITPGNGSYSTQTANGTTSINLTSVLGISQYINYNLIGGYYARGNGECKGGFGGGGCTDDNRSYGGGWSNGTNYSTNSFSSGSNTIGQTGAQNGHGYAIINGGEVKTDEKVVKVVIKNNSTQDATIDIGAQTGNVGNQIILSSDKNNMETIVE